ncbi:MAG: orotate phosphoribosyltransferase [Clostridiales bacterium]|nr:orotate phosphoribosyltransferase [Clostridiales bacterium]
MERQIAKDLLAIGAVFLRPDQPFTWASGIKSPIYCDNRLTLGHPAVRGRIEAALGGLIGRCYPDCQVLMGTSTAGIAHAAIVAHQMGLPMGYVRGGAKDHGRNNRIEGLLKPGWRAVVVEDLISTAGSAIETAQALTEAGARVLGVASIFTYGMARGKAALESAGLVNRSLTNFNALVGVAAELNYIAPGDVARLIAFRDNPSDPGWMEARA